MALTNHEKGYARQGASVFASAGPIVEHVESMLGDAAAALKKGRLGAAASLADATPKAVPNLAKAVVLEAQILRSQYLAASLGSSMAIVVAGVVYWARMNTGVRNRSPSAR